MFFNCVAKIRSLLAQVILNVGIKDRLEIRSQEMNDSVITYQRVKVFDKPFALCKKNFQIIKVKSGGKGGFEDIFDGLFDLRHEKNTSF